MPAFRARLTEFENGRNDNAGQLFQAFRHFSIALSSQTFRRRPGGFPPRLSAHGVPIQKKNPGLARSKQLSYAVPYLSYAAEY